MDISQIDKLGAETIDSIVKSRNINVKDFCSVDEFYQTITDILNEYCLDITEETKKNVDKVSKECNEEIKRHITFKQPTGKYVKSFRIKKSYEDKFNKRNTWYVTNGQYRLTHLLEKGHAKVNGGRTRAFPHIKYGEEIAKKRMEELTKEAIERANRH